MPSDRPYLTALLRLHGRAKPRRMRMAEPIALKAQYARKLREQVLGDAVKMVREHVLPLIEDLSARASRVATTDAVDQDALGEIIDSMSESYFKKWTRKKFADVVKPTGEATAKFQARALNAVIRGQLADEVSVDVVGNEPWLPRAVDEFTRENVALIRIIPEQYFSDIEKTVAREVADGTRFEEIAALLEERYGVASRRAELIARDQVAKFQGDLNRVRQTDLGITHFIWRSVGDERVRDEHQARDGKMYEWANPPDGETPGEAINDRCWAEPVLPNIE